MISTRWSADPNQGVATFFIIFGAYMNISFIINVKILVLIKQSYRSSPNYVNY